MSDELAVTLTIDGREVSVPSGTLVIRAAEQLGVYVPRFCDHPLLDPLGACRQCLVEIEGHPKPLTSCTTPVSQGMVVKTQHTSDMAREGQEGVLELLLINHPLDCPMCDKGGECPLQDQALAYGSSGSRFVDAKRRFVKPVPVNPLVKLDRERCVLCARCTRFADEISGDPFIELYERGALEQVGVSDDEPYRSVFSGNVIQICPVGALTSSTFRFKARPFDVTTAPGVCNRCSSGCAIGVQTRRGEIVRVLAAADPGVNDEWICDKGRFGYAYVHHPERVTEPLVRKAGELVAVSWAEALGAAAERIGGASAAAVLGGASLADEDAYALSRFARTVLGTNDVDARLRGGASDEDAVLVQIPRTATATNADVDRAALVVVVGTDLREESPILYLRVRKARRRGARIVVIGPRRTALASAGAEWIACAPGGEAGAMLALAAALERAGGSGLDPWTRASIAAPDAIDGSGADPVAISDLAAVIREDAVLLAGERLGRLPGALGLAWNIAAAVGARIGWVARKGGARGAVWAGLHPALLPGGRRVADESQRAEVEAVWGEVPAEPGRDSRTFLDAAERLDILYLVGADPVTDFAGSGGRARAVDAAPFVVAQDLFLTETTARADVLLPAAASYEREGTVTDWEGRPHRTGAAVPPPGSVQTDREILARLAETLGLRFPQTLGALRKEMSTLSVETGGTRPVRVDALPTRRSDVDYPLALEVVPLLIDDGTMMKGADLLRETAEDAFVELSVTDARALGIAAGELVRVSSRHGSLEARARVSADVAAGAVVVPSQAGGARAAPVDVGDPFTLVRVEQGS